MKPWFVAIQMKASKQYVHVVLFIMLYKVVLTCLWMKPLCVTIQMKAIEEHFHVVLFIIHVLWKMVLTF